MSTDQPADAPTLDELGLGELSPDIERHRENHQAIIAVTGEGERVCGVLAVRPGAGRDDVEAALRDLHLEALREVAPDRLERAVDGGDE